MRTLRCIPVRPMDGARSRAAFLSCSPIAGCLSLKLFAVHSSCVGFFGCATSFSECLRLNLRGSLTLASCSFWSNYRSVDVVTALDRLVTVHSCVVLAFRFAAGGEEKRDDYDFHDCSVPWNYLPARIWRSVISALSWQLLEFLNRPTKDKLAFANSSTSAFGKIKLNDV